MTEEHLIRHCSPTLAGLKTGSLFTCTLENKQALLCSMGQLNRRLKSKGLRLIPLRFSENRALIYLYRPKLLQSDLAGEAVSALMVRQGYCPQDCQQCINMLIQKLRMAPEFPHEIGLFLGYPPEDVQGFMENKACGCKCVGCWKVYGDEAAARKKFAQFKKCTRVYQAQWAKGTPIERLAVAV